MCLACTRNSIVTDCTHESIMRQQDYIMTVTTHIPYLHKVTSCS